MPRNPTKTLIGRYKLEPVSDSNHQWRLMELKRPPRGHARYMCVAIGTGMSNMQRLAQKLT